MQRLHSLRPPSLGRWAWAQWHLQISLAAFRRAPAPRTRLVSEKASRPPSPASPPSYISRPCSCRPFALRSFRPGSWPLSPSESAVLGWGGPHSLRWEGGSVLAATLPARLHVYLRPAFARLSVLARALCALATRSLCLRLVECGRSLPQLRHCSAAPVVSECVPHAVKQLLAACSCARPGRTRARSSSPLPSPPLCPSDCMPEKKTASSLNQLAQQA